MEAAVNSTSTAGAVPWHALTVDEVLKRLTTSTENGLAVGEASTRLQKYGPNRLPEGKKRGPFMRFLSQFNNILVYVLLGAGFTKLMLGLWLDAAIIFGVVILNALLGFIQEGKAEKALDSIRNMLSAEARTLRGGETRMIPAEQLVPGDIVLLESGDKVPADLRLADVKNLRTEEAALTGESVPADKTTDAVSDKATVGDRESMAFSGTMVVSGRATGVVVATGSETELGRINQLLAGVSALETPLLRQIKKFGYAITAVIGVVSVLVFAYGRWVKGMDFVEIFQAVVGIAVSVIPEGLPALITITLAIGVQRMAQRNAIIRRLPAVETLGLGVAHLLRQDRHADPDGDDGGLGRHRRIGSIRSPATATRPRARSRRTESQRARTRCSSLWAASPCSATTRSCSSRKASGRWKATRPRERSIRSRPSSEWTGKPSRPPIPRIDAIPFESEHKFMATLAQGRRRQGDAAGQGRAGGHPRRIATGSRPRTDSRRRSTATIS